MAQEIKRKIVLEGEKEFSAALKEAQRNLKTLRSELKAETAELGSNATAQQKAETRARSLQKQIAEQEKVVKTLQAALAQAKEQYGDNEDVVAKWEQKLNDARATLANMKNGLTEANQTLKETGAGFREAADGAAETVTATKSAADAMQELGGIGENVAGAIENIFFGMIDVIGQAVSAMWDMVTETAAKVNGWEDIAGYWNTDTQTIQMYARAVAASGNAFEDLNSAVSKLVLGGKGDKITEMLGISGVNYENDWDYAMAVMDQMYRLRESGTDMTPIFEEIFGEKKSTKVMDLLNDWGTITGLLETFNGDNGGYGLSSEALDSMAALHVQISTVEEKWQALKDDFTAGLGIATGQLLVNIEGSLDALNDYMNAGTPEERETALASLRTNVEEFFTKVADIIREGIAILAAVGEELSESEDPTTALIGKILVSLTDALGWMVDNQDAVIGAFEAIFGVWLVAKLASVAGQLASIVTQIQTIQAFNGLSAAAQASLSGAAGASAGAGAAGAGAGAATAGAAGGATVATGLPAWLSALSIGALFKTGWEVAEQTGMGLVGYWSGGGKKQIEGTMAIENIEELKAAYAEAQAEEAARQEAEERDAIAKDDYGLDNYKAGLLTSGIEGIESMAEEKLTALAQRMSDLGLSTGFAYGYETLDDLYRALKTEEKIREQEAEAEEEQLTVQEQNNALRNAHKKNVTGTASEESMQTREPEASGPSEDLLQMAESYWDFFRTHGGDEDWMVWEELEGYFQGQEDLLDRLEEVISQMTESDTWEQKDDLPANWWMDAASWRNAGNGGSLSSSDLAGFRSLPGSIAEAAKAGTAAGVSGIKVLLDGYTVGQLVAPYVSETIARDVII